MEWYTTEQAAKILGVSPRWIRQLCEEGRLGFRPGRNWYLTPRDIERYPEVVGPVGHPKAQEA